jgi:hypothetical protein
MTKVLALGASGPQETEVAVVAGVDRSVQFNNAGTQAGASRCFVDIDGNQYNAAINVSTATTLPTTPVANMLTRAAVLMADKKLYPVWTDPDGITFKVQDLIHEGNYWYCGSAQSGQVFTYFNCAFTVSGTSAVSVQYNAGSPITSKPRQKMASTATAGTLGTMYMSSSKRLYLNTYGANEQGQPAGFTECYRFGTEDAVANARVFIGLSTTVSAPTNVEPSTLLNCIGLIKRAADTNWQFYAAGASVGVVTDLGSSFAYSNGVTIDEYELLLHNPRGSASIYWQVKKLIGTSSVVVKGVVSLAANLPANQSFLSTRSWICNNTTAAIASLTVVHLAGSRAA